MAAPRMVVAARSEHSTIAVFAYLGRLFHLRHSVFAVTSPTVPRTTGSRMMGDVDSEKYRVEWPHAQVNVIYNRSDMVSQP